VTGAVTIAGEIAGAATALAGLILVFLGATAASFGGYEKTAQKTVRSRYQQQGWSALLGLIFALAATFFALIAKWNVHEGLAVTAFILLVVAAVFVAAAAITSVLEIK
jgi:hypothetical protein